VVRPFHLGWQATSAAPSRSRRIVDAVLALDEQTVADELALVMRDFEARHWQTQKVFITRCDEVATTLALDTCLLSAARRQLIGAYFCHEYSYAAAALMNPSVVPHVDQSGLGKDSVRIVLSLRAVGEGHISSVAFREGILGPEGKLKLAPQPPFATAADARSPEDRLQEGPVCVYRHADSTLSGTVLFPITPAQTNGLEDLRLLRFEHDDGSHEWLGTYTAYNGREIRSEMLSTRDFRSFHLTPLTGRAARNKGMGLFPRKIDGRYLMIGRQDGENLYLIASDTLTHWDEGKLLLTPKYSWSFCKSGTAAPPSSSTKAGSCSPTASARCANIRSAPYCSTRPTPPACSGARLRRCSPPPKRTARVMCRTSSTPAGRCATGTVSSCPTVSPTARWPSASCASPTCSRHYPRAWGARVQGGLQTAPWPPPPPAPHPAIG
jgi:hypothetical protein